MGRCVLVILVLLVFVTGPSVIVAQEVVNSRQNANDNNNNDGVIMVPDTGKIDSKILKEVSADKFLSLWFMYVLGGPTTIADASALTSSYVANNTIIEKITSSALDGAAGRRGPQCMHRLLLSLNFLVVISFLSQDLPWTLFVPLNNGLPDPGEYGFLTDKAATRKVLLNHALLGASIDPSAEPPADVVITEEGTPLIFTSDNGRMSVNGIKVIGKHITVEGGNIVIIESYLPVQTSIKDLLSKDVAKPVLPRDNHLSSPVGTQNTETEINLEDTFGSVTTSATTTTTKKVRPFPFRQPKRSNNPSSSSNGKTNHSDVSRPTRFDKFRNNPKNASQNILSRNSSFVNKFTLTNAETHALHDTLSGRLPTMSERATSNPKDATHSEGDVAAAVRIEESATTETLETTVISSSSTPNVLARFALAASAASSFTTETPVDWFLSTTEESSINAKVKETESPLLAFEKFIQTATNGKKFFPIIANESDNVNLESSTGNSESLPDLQSEFLDESEFIPFNEFLNSQNAPVEFSQAFEQLPETGVNATTDSDDADTRNSSSNFFIWFENEVKTRKQLGGKEFLYHLLESGVAKELTSDQKFTALVPTDEAFYAYYPIDWGFNPFLVESFLRRTLLEHLVEGDVALEDLSDNTQLTTLANTTLNVKTNNGGVTVDGVRVLTESEVLGPHGRMYSLPHLLHVTDQTVSLLRELHPHLERAPLLGSPWPMSQFLSHLLQRLQQAPVEGRQTTALFTEYLALSHLSHLVPSSDEDFNQLEYTALVPTDNSIITHFNNKYNTPGGTNSQRVVPGGLLDPFLQEAGARNSLVGRHILRGRYNLASLTPGTAVTTLLNDTLLVTAGTDGRVIVGGAEILPPGESIYNLGALFMVQGPLLLQGQGKVNGDTIEPTFTEAQAENAPFTTISSTPVNEGNSTRVVTRTEVSVSRRVSNGAEERVPASESLVRMLAAGNP